MQTVKINNLEVLPGYRLISPLGRGGFGEVWKCEAPGGLYKAIKFVRGLPNRLAESACGIEQELRALHHIKAIRHPFLLSLERVEIIDNDLVIVMELADRSMHDLLQQYRQAGGPGIPRDELLAYLSEAAEVLDLMNLQHGLQHLDIKPRNLFLVSGHVKVADFGLVNSMTDFDGQEGSRPCEAITPLYAAPEVFLGRLSMACDQYSLGITYMELLTGVLPFNGGSPRQLALQHMYDEPALHPLPANDRPIVQRALAKESSQRYPSCSDFIQDLLSASPPASSPRVRRPSGLVPRIDLSALNKAVGKDMPARPSQTVSATAVTRPTAEAAPPVAPSAPLAVLPGYQLLERLRFPDVAEAWKGQAAEGRYCLIRLLTRCDLEQITREGGPLARLRSLQHPRLMPLEVLVQEPRQVAVISDWPEMTLAERMRQCQQGGAIGIPRLELLDHLHQVARVLDELYQREGLQHLCLNPRQIAIHHGSTVLLDFALTELLWLPSGATPGELNLRHAAPEVLQQLDSRHGDQYSLAAIYYEMATGAPLFRNLSQRYTTAAKTQGQTDVSMLPSVDRAIVLRALHLNPEQRYPSCLAFIEALQSVAPDGKRSSARTPRVKLPPAAPGAIPEQASWMPPLAGDLEEAGLEAVEAPPPLPPLPSPDQIQKTIAEQIAAAAGPWTIRQAGALHYRFTVNEAPAEPGSRKKPLSVVILEHDAFGCLMPATVALKLKGFQEEWRLHLLEARGPWVRGGAEFQAHGSTLFQYALPLPASFWQRWWGKKPELRVVVTFTPIRRTDTGLAHVQIHIQSRDCEPEMGKELLESFGPSMLRTLHGCLQLSPERRSEERLPLSQMVRILPLVSPHEVGDVITAEARDISPHGMGLQLPCHPGCKMLLVELSLASNEKVYLPAEVRRVESYTPGRYHVGVQFLLEAPLESVAS